MKLIKHTLIPFAIVIFMLLSAEKCNNENFFEGTITYKVDLPEDIGEEVKPYMPTQIVVKYKGVNQKTIMQLGPQAMSIIVNGDKKAMYNLISAMGQKFYIETSFDEVKKEREKSKDSIVEIKYAEETKQVAGKNCKKATVIKLIEGEKVEDVIYFTEELGEAGIKMMDTTKQQVKGIPMEYDMPLNEEISFHLTATTVVQEKLKGTEFTVPESYVKKTKEELQQMGG